MWENTILVVVDAAANAHQPALERAAWLAKQAEGRLELFSCEWDPDIDAGRVDPGGRDRLLKQRQHELEKLAAPLRQQGLRVSVDVVWDHPFDVAILTADFLIHPIASLNQIQLLALQILGEVGISQVSYL